MPRADIQLEMGFNSSKVRKGLAKVEGRIKKFDRAVMRAANSLTKLGMGTAAGVLGLLSRSAIHLAHETNTLSKVAGANTEEFQKNAHAAKTVQVEQEKLADIYKDTNDKIGDFLQTGAGPMADFFEKIAPRVGATAEEFKNLSGPQALQRYYNYLSQANLSQAEMTFYMEAIASDATKLIPLLKNGGAEFKRLGEEAAAGGLVMSQATIDNLSRAQNHIDKFKRSATIKWGEIIGGEANFGALKELGFLLMAQAGKFGGAVRDHLRALGNVIQAGIGGSFEWVATRFGNSMEALVDTLHKRLILMGQEIAKHTQSDDEFIKTREKNTEKLMDLMVRARKRAAEEEAKTWNSLFEENIKDQKSLSDEYFNYWNSLAKEQRALIQEARKAAKEADSITRADSDGPNGEWARGTGGSGSGSTGGSGRGSAGGSGGQSHRQRLLADEMERNRALQKMEAERAANKTGLDNVPHIKSYRISSHRIGADDKGKPGTGPKSEATLLAEAEKTVNHLEGIYNILSSEED